MAAPPDFAMVLADLHDAHACSCTRITVADHSCAALQVREVRARALKMQQEVRDARAAAEAKEAVLVKLHSAMGMQPRFRFEKMESGGSARVIDVGWVVDKFVVFEKAMLESEKLLQQV